MSKNFDIGHTLRHLRDKSGLSVKDVAEKLEKLAIDNVKDKTIYNYEVGRTMPNADVFLELCVIYGCENPLKWWNQDNPVLDTDEKDIVNKYRKLPRDTQIAAQRQLDALYDIYYLQRGDPKRTSHYQRRPVDDESRKDVR